MTLHALAAFLLLAAAAAYVQTVTGFAFGLIMMAGVALAGLTPLPDAAAVVSLLTLANTLQMAAKGWRHIAWREWRLAVIGCVPMIAVGFALLHWLASERVDLLRLALAAAILAASLSVLRPPRPDSAAPRGWTYVAAGAFAGLTSGLFAAGGPPLVLRFYSAPLPLATIRETLVSIFALNSVIRLALVFGTGLKPPDSAWWGVLALPVVFAATAAARRWPPPVATQTIHRLVAALLIASALALAAPALPGLLAR
jgi:uncharacterized membrane protein YfcA